MTLPRTATAPDPAPLVAGDGPRELRRRAMERVLAITEADFAFFFLMYEGREGLRYGDMLIAGSAEAGEHLARLEGHAAIHGCAGTPAADAGGWRRASWDLRAPLPTQRDRFRPFDADVDRASIRRTPVWQELYAPLRVGDQVRALMYDDQRFVGWIGALRQGSAERFGSKVLEALEQARHEIRSLLVAAAARQEEAAGMPSLHAVLDSEGRVEHATAEAAAWLTRERLGVLRRAVVQLERSETSAGPVRLDSGLDHSLVRLDAGPSVRYLLTVHRAALPPLSPLHVLSPAQRCVAEYAANDATVAEIARALDVSPNTVKYHLKKVYELLHVGGRAELGALWSRWA